MEFTIFQWIMISIIFAWTGFVRTGIGFGGAALGLPLLLIVENSPLVFLPMIAIHLIFFTSLTAGRRLNNCDWGFVKFSMSWMLVPKILGVIGLLSLPTSWMVIFVFFITAIYAITWISQREIKNQPLWLDRCFLLIGGYISGASLVGAPLIASVAIRKVKLSKYRDTLFVLWFMLVTIKMTAFVIADVDLQIFYSAILLAPAAVGHLVGLRFHKQLLSKDSKKVKKIIGFFLLVVSIFGIFQSLY